MKSVWYVFNLILTMTTLAESNGEEGKLWYLPRSKPITIAEDKKEIRLFADVVAKDLALKMLKESKSDFIVLSSEQQSELCSEKFLIQSPTNNKIVLIKAISPKSAKVEVYGFPKNKIVESVYIADVSENPVNRPLVISIGFDISSVYILGGAEPVKKDFKWSEVIRKIFKN